MQWTKTPNDKNENQRDRNSPAHIDWLHKRNRCLENHAFKLKFSVHATTKRVNQYESVKQAQLY